MNEFFKTHRAESVFPKKTVALTFSPKLGLLAQLHYIVILKTVRQSFLEVKQGVLLMIGHL